MKQFMMLVAMLAFGSSTIFAQNTVDEYRKMYKERAALAKMATPAINKLAAKMAKKEAKRLTKEGWKPAPGGMPLEMQYSQLYTKQFMTTGIDQNALPAYITGEGTSLSTIYAGAKEGAWAQASSVVARQLSVTLAGVVQRSVDNKEMSALQAEGIQNTVSKSAGKFQENLSYMTTAVEAYRDINGKKEVMLVLIYPGVQARTNFLKSLSDDEKEAKETLDKLTEGWKK